MVTFTEKEWEAVEHKAVAATTLTNLLAHADQAEYTRLALPRQEGISSAKKARIKTLYNQGYSQEEISKMVDGVSTSSVSNILSGND
jgi:Holliday junction resolvasome RuvABC DNA-binding subunit